MEIDKTVSNPMLAGAMQLIKADGKTPVPEHQAMFMQELDKAELLAPAEIQAEVGEDGKLKEGGRTAVRFPMLTGSDGKKFFVVFSDNGSLEQAKSEEGASRLPDSFLKHTATVRFYEIARMILTKNPDGTDNPTFGIVINPFMENIVIPRTMILEMVKRTAETAFSKMGQAPVGRTMPGQSASVQPSNGQKAEGEGGQVIRFPFADDKKD